MQCCYDVQPRNSCMCMHGAQACRAAAADAGRHAQAALTAADAAGAAVSRCRLALGDAAASAEAEATASRAGAQDCKLKHACMPACPPACIPVNAINTWTNNKIKTRSHLPTQPMTPKWQQLRLLRAQGAVQRHGKPLKPLLLRRSNGHQQQKLRQMLFHQAQWRRQQQLLLLMP